MQSIRRRPEIETSEIPKIVFQGLCLKNCKKKVYSCFCFFIIVGIFLNVYDCWIYVLTSQFVLIFTSPLLL